MDTNIKQENDKSTESTYNEYQIHGYPVYFPAGKKPFPAQFAVISKVLQAMKEKKNALLESPTGTGKTLAFLTSTLSYQKAYNQNQNQPLSDHSSFSKETPLSPSKINNSHLDAPKNVSPVKENFAQKPLTIFYCTRTHSQLKQIADEMKKLPSIYFQNLHMSVLGSRNQLCVNKTAIKESLEPGKPSLNEICKELCDNVINLQNSENVDKEGLKFCRFFDKKKIEKVDKQLTSAKVWDIEDAVSIGKNTKGCSYQAVRNQATTANFILAPYNYIIDASIRSAVKIDLTNSIVVFDEAHNIEDVARDAASLDLEADTLKSIHLELSSFKSTNNIPVTFMFELIDNLTQWISLMIQTLDSDESSFDTNFDNSRDTMFSPYKQNGFKKFNNKMGEEKPKPEELVWDGDEFLSIMEEKYNLSHNTLLMYIEYLQQIKLAQDAQEDMMELFNGQSGGRKLAYENNSEDSLKPLSGRSIQFLESLLNVLNYMIRDKRKNSLDYRVVIQRKDNDNSSTEFSSGKKAKRKRRSSDLQIISTSSFPLSFEDEKISFHIWCMTSSVIFEDIGKQAASIILTSGTLSPLESFASELGLQFPIRVEAKHVINLSQQLSVGCIHSFNDSSLQATYQHQQSDNYLDMLGNILLLLMKQTPGGVLMFLPSYQLLNRVMFRWRKQRILSNIEISTGGRVYFEEKDGKVMKKTLQEYYDDLGLPGSKAALIAICRGKISEGINFSDHYARCVIVVGIPYPSIGDLKVSLKRKYQDFRKSDQMKKHSLGDLAIDGDMWYRQQAFRAVNQALGRCIRHKDDYGSIVLLDPRYEKITQYLSSWMRNEVVNYQRFEDYLLPLQNFHRGKNSYEKISINNQIQKQNDLEFIDGEILDLPSNPIDESDDHENSILSTNLTKEMNKPIPKIKDEKQKSSKKFQSISLTQMFRKIQDRSISDNAPNILESSIENPDNSDPNNQSMDDVNLNSRLANIPYSPIIDRSPSPKLVLTSKFVETPKKQILLSEFWNHFLEGNVFINNSFNSNLSLNNGSFSISGKDLIKDIINKVDLQKYLFMISDQLQGLSDLFLYGIKFSNNTCNRCELHFQSPNDHHSQTKSSSQKTMRLKLDLPLDLYANSPNKDLIYCFEEWHPIDLVVYRVFCMSDQRSPLSSSIKSNWIVFSAKIIATSDSTKQYQGFSFANPCLFDLLDASLLPQIDWIEKDIKTENFSKSFWDVESDEEGDIEREELDESGNLSDRATEESFQLGLTQT